MSFDLSSLLTSGLGVNPGLSPSVFGSAAGTLATSLAGTEGQTVQDGMSVKLTAAKGLKFTDLLTALGGTKTSNSSPVAPQVLLPQTTIEQVLADPTAPVSANTVIPVQAKQADLPQLYAAPTETIAISPEAVVATPTQTKRVKPDVKTVSAADTRSQVDIKHGELKSPELAVMPNLLAGVVAIAVQPVQAEPVVSGDQTKTDPLISGAKPTPQMQVPQDMEPQDLEPQDLAPQDLAPKNLPHQSLSPENPSDQNKTLSLTTPIAPSSVAPPSAAPVQMAQSQISQAQAPQAQALQYLQTAVAPKAAAYAESSQVQSLIAPGLMTTKTAQTETAKAGNGARNNAATATTGNASASISPVQITPASVASASPVQADTQIVDQATVTSTSVTSRETAPVLTASDKPSDANAFTLTQVSSATPSSYTASASTPMPASSNMSQSALENLNALSVQISRRANEGKMTFNMELQPANMGRVDVALNIAKDGKLTAKLSFDTDMTAESFSAHESDLRQQLTRIGLVLDDNALSFTSRTKPDSAPQTMTQAAVSQPGSSSGSQGTADARPQDNPTQNGFQQNSQNHNSQQQGAFMNGQQGQHRPTPEQVARHLAHADQAMAEADLDAALQSGLNGLAYRPSHASLALNLIV